MTSGPRHSSRPGTTENERHDSAEQGPRRARWHGDRRRRLFHRHPDRVGATGGGSSPDGALVKRSDIKIEIVTHGQAQDGFWGVVRNGVKAGASQMGVTANYSAPGAESDMPGMVSLIDAAVAKKPTGLVVSIPNPDALGPAIQKAVDAGIPVVSMNSGSDVFKELGILVHVGQTEYEAGLGGGQRFKDAGVKNARCFNQEVGNQALTLRCNGFFMGLTGAEDGKVLTGNISDPAGMQATIAAELQSDPTIDGLLTLGPSVAKPALDAVAVRQDRPPRDLRPQRRRADGHQGREDGLRHRSAAVPPGLPADRDPHELRRDQEPARRRRGLDHDRPRVRHPEGRRGRHRARREGSALSG